MILEVVKVGNSGYDSPYVDRNNGNVVLPLKWYMLDHEINRDVFVLYDKDGYIVDLLDHQHFFQNNRSYSMIKTESILEEYDILKTEIDE